MAYSNQSKQEAITVVDPVCRCVCMCVSACVCECVCVGGGEGGGVHQHSFSKQCEYKVCFAESGGGAVNTRRQRRRELHQH